MAAEAEYVPDSDDEMGPDTSGDEMADDEEKEFMGVALTPQEWKEKAGDLYKVWALLSRSIIPLQQYSTLPHGTSDGVCSRKTQQKYDTVVIVVTGDRSPSLRLLG